VDSLSVLAPSWRRLEVSIIIATPENLDVACFGAWDSRLVRLMCEMSIFGAGFL
jgi:hypothetical protein